MRNYIVLTGYRTFTLFIRILRHYFIVNKNKYLFKKKIYKKKVCIFPAGVWFCIKELNDERVFIILYALFASYFAGVMVRLILTLTPCVCVLSAIALSKTFDYYLYDESARTFSESDEITSAQAKEKPQYDKADKVPSVFQGHKPKQENSLNGNIKGLVVIILSMLLVLFAVHCTWVTSNAYSSPSIVLATYSESGHRQIIDDYREAYYWLRKNTDDDARIMSWWDYGYQIAGMGSEYKSITIYY